MDLHALALRELPSPPARVLEVGCGGGGLARALAADGYDLVAVDPNAPAGPIFRRTTLESLEDEEPFDGPSRRSRCTTSTTSTWLSTSCIPCSI